MTRAQTADKNFSDQLADLVLREKAHHATAHIIESAQVPSIPVRPKKAAKHHLCLPDRPVCRHLSGPAARILR